METDRTSSLSSGADTAAEPRLVTVHWDGGQASPLRCSLATSSGSDSANLERGGENDGSKSRVDGTRSSNDNRASACVAEETGLVEPLDWAERLALQFLVSNPYPINVAGDDSTELHCFGP